jgi:hypothetical protein
MTILHPARAGSPITVWFVKGVPVRLLSGTSRFRVVGDPRCADINGTRYWRVRARSDDGRHATFDIREGAEGWILEGVEDDAAPTGTS